MHSWPYFVDWALEHLLYSMYCIVYEIVFDELHNIQQRMFAGARYRIHLYTNRLIRYHAALWWR